MEHTTISEERTAERLRIVKEHVRHENRHDLEAIMETFGETGQYDDEPWGEHHEGLAAVRSYYEQLLQALPDLFIDVKQRHVTEEAIVQEVIISGTHEGPWRGLPGTGRRVQFPLCAVFTFDANNKLAGERIYYDRATVLRQIGAYHEPTSMLGRLTTALTHPLTVTRALSRGLLSRRGYDASP